MTDPDAPPAAEKHLMQIAFYLARYGNALDKAIDDATGRGGISHVELVFGDGRFFSSSPRDGGCRFKLIVPDEHWEIVPIRATPEQEAAARAFCVSQDGKGYSWRGDINFILPVGTDGDRKWFCSEVCAQALIVAGLIGNLDPAKVSPNELRQIIAADESLHA